MAISKMIAKSVEQLCLLTHLDLSGEGAIESSHSWSISPKLRAFEMTVETTLLSACSMCSEVQMIVGLANCGAGSLV